jgi:transcriptional regulator with XRE-family HTH domain
MVHVPEGFRIGKFRKRRKLTQSALAKEVGISTSYLNLIEHNKRPIGGKLLGLIARRLGVDINELSGYDDARLIQDLIDLSSNPLFRDLPMEDHGAQNIIGREPGWGRAILHLYACYKGTIDTIESLSERINRDPFLVETSHEILTHITVIRSVSEILAEFDDLADNKRKQYTSLISEQCSILSSAAKSFFAFLDEVDATINATTPAGEVEGFFIEQRNYFPTLENAAETLRKRVEPYAETIDGALSNYLSQQHGIVLKRPAPEADAPAEVSPLHHSNTRIDYRKISLIYKSGTPRKPNDSCSLSLSSSERIRIF